MFFSGLSSCFFPFLDCYSFCFLFSWLFLLLFAERTFSQFFHCFLLVCFYSAVFNMFVVFLSFIPRIISCFSSLSIRVYNIVCFSLEITSYSSFPFFCRMLTLHWLFFSFHAVYGHKQKKQFDFFSPQVDICLWYIDPTHLSGLCLFALASELNLAVIFFSFYEFLILILTYLKNLLHIS